MGITLGNFIAKITDDLINEADAIVLGQCLTAVGWVAGTVPSWVNKKNIIELSMADVANGGIAVGAALNQNNPVIYVVRYQGFLWYNAISIVNYAAKSKEMFDIGCPLLVRAIAMEGAIGPVAGNSQHSLVLRMPGINVFEPMSVNEWEFSWDYHHSQRDLPTIIFDEIDTGTSGEIASKISEILEKMSKKMQVFAITHLHQIASKGNAHYKVYKQTIGN